MPIPKPTPGEKQSNFISKCMASPALNKDFPDQKRRAAVCYSQYRRSKKVKGSDSEPEWEDFESQDVVIY